MTTLEKAVKRFGAEHQARKLCEECGELMTAVMHCLESRDSADHVAEEIADVTIMMEQMLIAFGIRQARVNWWRDTKLERLEARLENHD